MTICRKDEKEWCIPLERARKTDLEGIFRSEFHRRITEKFVFVSMVRAVTVEQWVWGSETRRAVCDSVFVDKAETLKNS